MNHHATDYSAQDDTMGGRISFARCIKGLTVAEAARRHGVLWQTWSDWECDRDAPLAASVLTMAALLGVTPCWILEGVGPGPFDHPSVPLAFV